MGEPVLKSNKEVITEFLTEMATQDNRSTAFPIYFTIRYDKKVYVPTGRGSDCDFYCDGNIYESKEVAKKELLAMGHLMPEVKKLLEKGEYLDYKMEPEDRGMFLTESDAERHLKANHYKYPSDAHTYVDHAYRAPKMTAFFEALFAEYGIKLEYR